MTVFDLTSLTVWNSNLRSAVMSATWTGGEVNLADALRSARIMSLSHRPHVENLVVVLGAAASVKTDFNFLLAEAGSLKNIARQDFCRLLHHIPFSILL